MRTLTILRIAAVLFAVAYFASQFVPTLPEGAYSDSRVAALLDGNDRTLVIAGGYLLVAAGIAALVFTRALDRALGGRSLAGTAGTIYSALLLVAAVMFVTVPLASAVGELPGEAPVEAFRILAQGAFVTLLLPALLVALVMVIDASLAIRTTGGAAGWVVAVGFVVAPLLLLGFAWAPQFLVPIWAVVVAFGLRESAEERPSVGSTSWARVD